MLHQHGTPYVTPHILHKSYAQSHDSHDNSNRESPPFHLSLPSLSLLFQSSSLSYVSRRKVALPNQHTAFRSSLLGYDAGMIHRAFKHTNPIPLPL